MSEKIYQILYCSRNNIRGTEAEMKGQIEAILRSSRANNERAGVTGALFYNKVFFAQVLEGSFAEVQTTFERLQLDRRHSDLVVLQSGYVSAREFGAWSMAYSSEGTDFALPSPPPGVAHGTAQLTGEQVSSFLRGVVIHQENWALPSRTAWAG